MSTQQYPLQLDINALKLYAQTQIVSILEQIMLAAVAYAVLCLCIYRISCLFRVLPMVRFPENRFKRILIVTAHPDDECMFFGPTILSLSRLKNVQVYLLCLSNGNYYKNGRMRRAELWKSCDKLQMRPDNVILCNVTELQDSPLTEWKAEILSRIIKKYVDTLDIDAIITFDRDGISRHPNHMHIYNAIASLYMSKSIIESDCCLFTLDTISVIRKYMLLFDLPFTFLLSSKWFILSWTDYSIVRSAMHQHKSQLVWFRRLYILFSRYMLINSLRPVGVSDMELDAQLEDEV